MGAGWNRGGSRVEGEEQGTKKRREGESERTEEERGWCRWALQQVQARGDRRKKKRGREGGEQTKETERLGMRERERTEKKERGEGEWCAVCAECRKREGRTWCRGGVRRREEEDEGSAGVGGLLRALGTAAVVVGVGEEIGRAHV